MRIDISAQKKIDEIQDEFHRLFPFLKLEFFTKSHKPGISSARRLIRDHSQTLAQCGISVEGGSISITPGMSVSELEQNFLKQFGLAVQVFRKSGNIWLETSITDKWTLEKQNLQGRELSEPREIERDEIEDFREQE